MDPPAFHFTFGILVHRIIELYTKSRGSLDIGKIAAAVLAGETSLQDSSEERAPALTGADRQRLHRHLYNFLRLAQEIGTDGEVEWHFDYDLSPPVGKMVTGFIDRLIHKADQVVIIDYKTGKPSRWRKTATSIVYDLQLQCYCWAAQQRYQVPARNISAALYYLEDAKLVPVRFCEQTLAQVPRALLAAYDTILAQPADQVVGRVGEHCRFCDWRRLCPFWRLTDA